jgi:hypothetical protein
LSAIFSKVFFAVLLFLPSDPVSISVLAPSSGQENKLNRRMMIDSIQRRTNLSASPMRAN